jgi:hypothetical protein
MFAETPLDNRTVDKFAGRAGTSRLPPTLLNVTAAEKT